MEVEGDFGMSCDLLFFGSQDYDKDSAVTDENKFDYVQALMRFKLRDLISEEVHRKDRMREMILVADAWIVRHRLGPFARVWRRLCPRMSVGEGFLTKMMSENKLCSSGPFNPARSWQA